MTAFSVGGLYCVQTHTLASSAIDIFFVVAFLFVGPSQKEPASSGGTSYLPSYTTSIDLQKREVEFQLCRGVVCVHLHHISLPREDAHSQCDTQTHT
jgi:hypothetical protein